MAQVEMATAAVKNTNIVDHIDFGFVAGFIKAIVHPLEFH